MRGERKTTTIDEFNAACAIAMRWGIVLIAATLATTAACFAFVLPFRDQIRTAYEELFGSTVGGLLMGLTPLPGVVVMFLGVWLLKRHCQTTGLVCPHCGTSQLGWRHAVIATKNCHHCGQRVLAEPN